MPIYPLSPGCVFREDFTSYDTVLANDGVITGSPTIQKSFTPTSTNYINYNRQTFKLFNLPIVTICWVNNNYVGFTGTTRNVLRVHNTVVGGRYSVGYASSSNTVYWVGSSTVVSDTISTSGKKFISIVYDGTNVSFYVNGVLSGTPSASGMNSVARENLAVVIGLNSQPLNLPLKTVQLYEYAFTAADALDWYNMAVRTY